MTIGIGVLASEGEGIKPNRVILIADTKGSFGDDYSMNRLHKIFTAPSLPLWAVGADQLDRAAELFQVMIDMSAIVHGGVERYGSIRETLGAAADLYKRVRFKLDVLPQFARMPQSIPDMFTDEHLTPELLKAWRAYDFGCQMIVGAFNKVGQAFLFGIEGTGEVQNYTFPGFAAIGSGLNNAMFWLSYRNHHWGFSVRRAAYHAFEAKIMADSSPHVSENVDMLIVDGERWHRVSDTLPSSGESPVQLQELREMFAKYGPRDTEEIK